jgi:hypothetical protein
VGAAKRAHVQGLVARIQDQNLLHPGRNVPDEAAAKPVRI